MVLERKCCGGKWVFLLTLQVGSVRLLLFEIATLGLTLLVAIGGALDVRFEVAAHHSSLLVHERSDDTQWQCSPVLVRDIVMACS